jgi:hypothetical protein
MKTLLSFLIILSIYGCSHQKNINGEIFIVTQGGENYKLGLVTIGLVHSDKLKPIIENKIKEATKWVQPIYQTYWQMEDSLALLDNLYNELRNKINNTRYDDHIKKIHLYEECKSNLLKAMSIEKRIAPLKLIYKEYTSDHFYLEDLPKFEDSSKTDSDGKFNFVVQKDDKYFIIASASRLIGSNKENYTWIVEYPNPSFREDQKILLSNDNLLDPLSMMNLKKR